MSLFIYFSILFCLIIHYVPDFENIWRGIFVRPSVRHAYYPWTVKARVLKFRIWISHAKIANTFAMISGLKIT